MNSYYRDKNEFKYVCNQNKTKAIDYMKQLKLLENLKINSCFSFPLYLRILLCYITYKLIFILKFNLEERFKHKV